MKFFSNLVLASTFFVTTLFPINIAKAATSFGEKELDQTQVVAIARPYGQNGQNNYDLLILEQIPDKRECWAENGVNPVIIDPLLLNFDFTGMCERKTDSNGYSIRIDGEDYGLSYLLRLVERNGELILLGTPRTPGQPEIIVGRTNGMIQGQFLKIFLNPGWRFTKRTFGQKILGHIYLSGKAAEINNELTPREVVPPTTETLPPSLDDTPVPTDTIPSNPPTDSLPAPLTPQM